MAKVKTFRIDRRYGIPDREIRDFVSAAEQEMVISVHMLYVPPLDPKDGQVLVVITKLDDLDAQLAHIDISNDVSQLEKKIGQLQGK